MWKVADFKEEELLSIISPHLPAGKYTLVGPGDDCAEISSSPSFVVTTDVLVENQHFRRDWSTAAEIGERAAMQNLADIAAMGAVPTAVEVSLVLPASTPVDWLGGFADGLGRAIKSTGAGVVGGDLSRGSLIVISVTMQGTCVGDGVKSPVLRSGAQPGDVVAVAGTLGRSAAGLAVLTIGAVRPSLHGDEVPEPFTEAVRIFRVPHPPLEHGRAAALAGATAMMDVSDGLALDAKRLATASGVSINFSSEALAADVQALTAVGHELEKLTYKVATNPWEWVLYGGEDHSLLATFPSEASLPDGFRVIGEVDEPTKAPADAEVVRVTLAGQPIGGGWQHFGS